MRAIEFRGKRKDNGEWVYGYVDATMYKDTVVIHTENATHEIDPDTIGQLTGLYDNKHVPIYEGDIIDTQVKINKHYYIYRCVVCFGFYSEDAGSSEGFEDTSHYGWYVKIENTQRDEPIEEKSIMEWLEVWLYERKDVVGNIHDNIELLKGGQQ